jgi:hypothetical protein
VFHTQKTTVSQHFKTLSIYKPYFRLPNLKV